MLLYRMPTVGVERRRVDGCWVALLFCSCSSFGRFKSIELHSMFRYPIGFFFFRIINFDL